MTTGNLKKILAAIVASPLILALSTLPDPWGKVAAAVVALVSTYVNWGHKDENA